MREAAAEVPGAHHLIAQSPCLLVGIDSSGGGHLAYARDQAAHLIKKDETGAGANHQLTGSSWRVGNENSKKKYSLKLFEFSGWRG